jgi:hypothetical protein
MSAPEESVHKSVASNSPADGMAVLLSKRTDEVSPELKP